MTARFSEKFRLGCGQADLAFVDVLLNTDLPLYVDPFAFKIGVDDWSIECNNLVVDFFEQVVESIKHKNYLRGRELLSNLHEPNTTHLGLSKNRPAGRGIGKEQADDLFNRLKGSKAIETGILQDLSDCELFIPGIAGDKISDITINIIRGKLVEFTTAQCLALGIPTQSVPTGPAWDYDNSEWRNGYARLPVYENLPVILVPKASVRWRIAVDDREYFDHFVLHYLQQENLSSNSSLVKVLKSGRRVVTKKSIREQLTYTKDLLREFSEKHPDVFEKYKESLKDRKFTPNDGFLEALIRAVESGQPVSLTYIREANLVGNKNVVHGDNFGGAVGQGNTVTATNFTVYKTSVEESKLDPELKDSLIKAREALETLTLGPPDKEDVAESLVKLKVELEQPQKDEGRIKRYIKRIAEIAPSIVTILGSAQSLYHMIHG